MMTDNLLPYSDLADFIDWGNWLAWRSSNVNQLLIDSLQIKPVWMAWLFKSAVCKIK